jgi:hypothetical protein
VSAATEYKAANPVTTVHPRRGSAEAAITRAACRGRTRLSQHSDHSDVAADARDAADLPAML